MEREEVKGGMMQEESRHVRKQHRCGCRDVEVLFYEDNEIIGDERFFEPCDLHDYDNSPPLHVVMDAVLYGEVNKDV